MTDPQPNTLTLADITVRIFMRCLFNKDFTGVQNWEELYTSYVDTSGIANEGELGLQVSIHNLEARLTHITGWLELQAKVFKITGLPEVETLDDIRKYGHRPTNTPENFEFQLTQIEAKEKRNVSQLNKFRKELTALQAIKQPETVNARQSFTNMLTALGKGQGYAINKDTTDMEELCSIIKTHNEQARQVQNN